MLRGLKQLQAAGWLAPAPDRPGGARLPADLLLDRRVSVEASARPASPPEFGVPAKVPLHGDKPDATEVDMRLGVMLVESKLTETDFTQAPPEIVHRYRDFGRVFDPAMLMRDGEYCHYQLIRYVLAAYACNGEFWLMCDARRSNLVRDWRAIVWNFITYVAQDR